MELEYVFLNLLGDYPGVNIRKTRGKQPRFPERKMIYIHGGQTPPLCSSSLQESTRIERYNHD